MGQFDSPQSALTKTDVQHLKTNDPGAEEKMKLFHDLMGDPKTGVGAKKQGPTVSGIGQIESMNLPADFEPGKKVFGTLGNSSFQEYHLKSDPDVKFYFEYRGHRTTDLAARAFKDVLRQPPHPLSNDEINKLRETLGTRANPNDFNALSIKTEDLNGKRVLVVEGRYPQHNLTARTIYIDADGTGSAVQEATFQTPAGEYARRLVSGMNAFKSIKWK